MNGNVLRLSLLIGIVCVPLSLPSFGQAPPPNDDFSNRTVLVSDDISFSGSLAGATLEPGEALGGQLTNEIGGYESQSVWWTWTASQTSLVEVELVGASQDSAATNSWPVDGIAIYDTSNIFAQPQPLAERPLDVAILCETVAFSATAGSNYQIQMRGSSSTTYQFRLMATNSPLILQPPQNVTVSSNASALFTVVADGYSPLSYQWQFEGTNLEDQTAPMLAFTNIDGSQAGSYTVIITNTGGAVTSAPAILAVSVSNVPPVLTAMSGEPGQFIFAVTGEMGRNYRIESSVDLVGWTNDYSFPRYPYTFDKGRFSYAHDNPFLTSVVFNSNTSSSFVISNAMMAEFLRASQYQPANEICINNLRQIRFATSLWVRGGTSGFSHTRSDAPVGRDLVGYFPQNSLPHCPLAPNNLFAYSYVPGSSQFSPICSIVPETHILGNRNGKVPHTSNSGFFFRTGQLLPKMRRAAKGQASGFQRHWT